MIRFYDDTHKGWLEDKFFKLKNKVSAHVKYKILLFSKSPSSHQVRNTLHKSIQALKKGTNTEVQSNEERFWIGGRHHRTAITLTIIDNSIVIISEKECFSLAYKKEIVSQYSKLFNRNWNTAKDEGSL